MVQFTYIYAQENPKSVQNDTVNKFDKSGNKHGFWMEESNGYRNLGKYLHGLKQGEWKTFFLNDEQIFMRNDSIIRTKMRYAVRMYKNDTLFDIKYYNPGKNCIYGHKYLNKTKDTIFDFVFGYSCDSLIEQNIYIHFTDVCKKEKKYKMLKEELSPCVSYKTITIKYRNGNKIKEQEINVKDNSITTVEFYNTGEKKHEIFSKGATRIFSGEGSKLEGYQYFENGKMSTLKDSSAIKEYMKMSSIEKYFYKNGRIKEIKTYKGDVLIKEEYFDELGSPIKN